MGHRIRAQKRGRGSIKYRTSNKYKTCIHYSKDNDGLQAVVLDIKHDSTRTCPIMKVRFENSNEDFLIAPEGIKVGDDILIRKEGKMSVGNVMNLSNIPEGTFIHNIENRPGDGGKLVRSAGTFATVVSHDASKTVVQLPSKVMKTFNSNCKATVGIVAGGGRHEKPFVTAGKRQHLLKGRPVIYPRVSATAMNVVDHPFGGGGHDHAGRPTTVSRSRPPGRKVGQIAAKRTGRRR
ncbi:MAG: 50S ribosomal protein L2 [Candidatus Methanofastidiosa archaeon]|nr:50S ribosomal protein L2 [Candidatus Methanofastidiosa archaeon]